MNMNHTNTPKSFIRRYTDEQYAIITRANTIKPLPNNSYYGFKTDGLYVAGLINTNFRYKKLQCSYCFNNDCDGTCELPIIVTIPKEDITIHPVQLAIPEVSVEIVNEYEIDTSTFIIEYEEEVESENENDLVLSIDDLNIASDDDIDDDTSQIDIHHNNIYTKLNFKARITCDICNYPIECEYLAKLFNKKEADHAHKELMAAIIRRDDHFIYERLVLLKNHFANNNKFNHFDDDIIVAYILAFTRLINNSDTSLYRFRYVPLGNTNIAKQHFVYTIIMGSMNYSLDTINDEKYIRFDNIIKIGHSIRDTKYERFSEHLNDHNGIFISMNRYNDNVNNDNYGVITYKQVINDYTIRCVTSNSAACEQFMKTNHPTKAKLMEIGYTDKNKIRKSDEVFINPGLMKFDNILNIIPIEYHNKVNALFDSNINEPSKVIFIKLIKPVMKLSGVTNYKQMEHDYINKDLLNSDYTRWFTACAMHYHYNYKFIFYQMIEYLKGEFDSINKIYETNAKVDKAVASREKDIKQRDIKIEELEDENNDLKSDIELKDEAIELKDEVIDNLFDIPSNIALPEEAKNKFILAYNKLYPDSDESN